MDEVEGHLVAEIISNVGSPRFAEATAHAMCAFALFELGSVILHKRDAAPHLMFEDLGGAGDPTGIENYLRFTHRNNPILNGNGLAGTFRASDFRLKREDLRADLENHLVYAPEEELGFRTIGWPAHLEELGLYFRACGGIVEFSLYRERSRSSAPSRTLHILDVMRLPLAAAFERHVMLADASKRPSDNILARLSPREGDVAKLLLTGCSSEAISLRLGIARYTVKDHRKEIFRKLRIGSLAELFALAPIGDR